MRSFKDLVSNIDKLQLPSQLAAVLDNRMLQHVVACNPDGTNPTRRISQLQLRRYTNTHTIFRNDESTNFSLAISMYNGTVLLERSNTRDTRKIRRFARQNCENDRVYESRYNRIRRLTFVDDFYKCYGQVFIYFYQLRNYFQYSMAF